MYMSEVKSLEAKLTFIVRSVPAIFHYVRVYFIFFLNAGDPLY